MQHPITLKLQEDGQREVHGTTRDVSEIGVLLITASEVSQGTRVELTLTLLQDNAPGVCLCGSGEIVRVEAGTAGARAVAVECDQALGETFKLVR